MRQNVGLSAVILAIVAFAIRSGGPGPPSGQGGRTQNGQVQGQAKQNPGEVDIEGPWLATRPFFHAADNPETPTLTPPFDFKTPASVRSCAAAIPACRPQLVEYFGIPASEQNQIQFLIATIPDPLHSRLSLFTDSSIQAIEDAAQASNWIFAGEWLPWIDSANPEEKDPEKRRAQREAVRQQEKQPGILVFRRSARPVDSFSGADLLLVFLVGETPTAGINTQQFQLARAYMRAIHEPSDEVRILGPTFSGSFYSLAHLLNDDRAQGPVRQYQARSGTVTGVNESSALTKLPATSFRGATANTDDQNRYFRSALAELGIGSDQAAQLVEDESAFGNEAAGEALPRVKGDLREPIRVFRFPREISHLRNAYKDAVAASKSGAVPSANIEFSIKDPETGEDSTPIFSASQSPLSQNGAINGIANAIRRDDIRLVWVQATNVLDLLFLANVIKRQCPDTRLLVNQADVLFVQAAQSEPLTGTLVLASYPMFFESSNWMGDSQRYEPANFPDANSEGVYNAAVLLLNEESAAAPILADYHWGKLHHPPTWLLTLDHQGFLPVNVYPHTEEQEKKETWFQMVKPAGDQQTPTLNVPPRIWSVAAAGLGLGGLALSVWIWWISSHPTYESDARFSFIPIHAESSWRRIHIFGLLLVLLSIQIALWVPALWAKQPTGFILLLALSGIVILATALRTLKYLRHIRNARLAPWLGAAVAAASLGLWVTSCFASFPRSLFFAFRARELRFGSSPTWPVLASLGALALLEFVHLTRCHLIACRRPEIVTGGLKTALGSRMREAWKGFNVTLKSAFGLRLAARVRLASLARHRLAARSGVVPELSKGAPFRIAARMRYSGRTRMAGLTFLADPRFLGIVLLALGLGLGALFRVYAQARSIDDPAYNLLAFVLHILVIGSLLLACIHLRWLWRWLQAFLAALGSLPLAAYFEPADRSGADRPIWVRRLHLQSIDIHIQSMYVLHNMSILSNDALALDPLPGGIPGAAQNQLRSLPEFDPEAAGEGTAALA